MSDRHAFSELRSRYRFACGYCTVTESECGSLLERDHFQPKAAGGQFHIGRLHLNRPPLVALRLRRVTQAEVRRQRAQFTAELDEIRANLERLERMITETAALIREPGRDV